MISLVFQNYQNTLGSEMFGTPKGLSGCVLGSKHRSSQGMTGRLGHILDFIFDPWYESHMLHVTGIFTSN